MKVAGEAGTFTGGRQLLSRCISASARLRSVISRAIVAIAAIFPVASFIGDNVRET